MLIINVVQYGCKHWPEMSLQLKHHSIKCPYPEMLMQLMLIELTHQLHLLHQLGCLVLLMDFISISESRKPVLISWGCQFTQVWWKWAPITEAGPNSFTKGTIFLLRTPDIQIGLHRRTLLFNILGIQDPKIIYILVIVWNTVILWPAQTNWI